jgi:uncharacterized membrane protein
LGVVSVFLSYVLSFVYVGIYWNNHHHLLHATKRVNGRILWANLHLLVLDFAVPVRNSLDGREPWKTGPDHRIRAHLAYGCNRLVRFTVCNHRRRGALRRALGRDWKGKLSPLVYLGALAFAFVSPWIAVSLYSFVAVLWLVPDRRIERALHSHEL